MKIWPLIACYHLALLASVKMAAEPHIKARNSLVVDELQYFFAVRVPKTNAMRSLARWILPERTSGTNAHRLGFRRGSDSAQARALTFQGAVRRDAGRVYLRVDAPLPKWPPTGHSLTHPKMPSEPHRNIDKCRTCPDSAPLAGISKP